VAAAVAALQALQVELVWDCEPAQPSIPKQMTAKKVFAGTLDTRPPRALAVKVMGFWDQA
jgi:hypothetical protein